MQNYVVVLLTNIAPTGHSRPIIVRTVLPAASAEDAKILCRSVHGTTGNDWRRQAEVCMRLHWAGGRIMIPIDQLAALGVAIEDALKDLDVIVETEATNRPMKVQEFEPLDIPHSGPTIFKPKRGPVSEDDEFEPEDPRH